MALNHWDEMGLNVQQVPVILPTDDAARKQIKLATHVLDYFPLALAAVAEISAIGMKQYNLPTPGYRPGAGKSTHEDSLMNHLVDRGQLDKDGGRHSAKVAWRALAMLQDEIVKEQSTPRAIPQYGIPAPAKAV